MAPATGRQAVLNEPARPDHGWPVYLGDRADSGLRTDTDGGDLMAVRILNATTTIAPERTIAEIQGILAKHGARAIMVDYDLTRQPVGLSFFVVVNGVEVPFKLPVNWQAVKAIMYPVPQFASYSQKQRLAGKDDQARRVAWRIIKDWVEAQMALLDTQQVKLEQIFLPYAQTADGRTVYELFVASPRLLLAQGAVKCQ